MLKTTESYFEVAVLGENASEVFAEMQTGFQPNILWAFSKNESEIPILKSRFVKEKTLIYVCEKGICKLPVENAGQAIELLKADKN